ncbi:MAG TPA: hypothetical protein VF403_08845 [Kofleriaceae bacterium]
MNTRFGLWLVIAESVLGMVVAARTPDPIARAPVVKKTERPWLTHEAKSQLVGPDGTPGPLFAGVTLGGSPPSAEARARIAEFARANHLDIRLEVSDDELRAIRLSVTFGGCCGYEGADSLASRFHRPKRQSCIDCKSDWVDDWSIALDIGVNIRARVRVNRFEVRWEPTLSTTELLETADGIVGKQRAEVTKAAAERWIELEHGHRYTLEVPYPFRHVSYGEYAAALPDSAANLQIEGEHGHIDEVAFTLRDGDIDDVKATMRAHWGRPHVAGSTWVWKKHDRTITAEVDDYSSAVTIHAL